MASQRMSVKFNEEPTWHMETYLLKAFVGDTIGGLVIQQDGLYSVSVVNDKMESVLLAGDLEEEKPLWHREPKERLPGFTIGDENVEPR